MKKSMVSARTFLVLLTAGFFVSFVVSVQGCKKEKELEASSTSPGTNIFGKKKGNTPPPAPVFYFTNCNSPTYTTSFVVGTPTTMTFTKNYVNSPGGSYPAFTSATVNGMTFSAPAGTFNTGSGSVVFTATGTPLSTGYFSLWIGVGNIQQCMMFFYVTNAPASGPTVDPGNAFGSTGVVNFTYKGQSVAYKTVRAKDGKIWLQQNLGSPQVAFHENDQASYGDYFQWGRWDDGHQNYTSQVISGSSSLMNPSHIPSGYPKFISGTTAGSKWWSVGGLATDTWSGTTITSTNGKDPCTALGAGWHLPSANEWLNLSNVEDLSGTMAAFQSNLRLTAAGYRGIQNGDVGYYWTSTALANGEAKVFFFDNNYNATVGNTQRAEGFSCRCVKN